MTDDYYQALGVSRNASAEEIQKAYRELARKSHPDLNPDDPRAKENFQKIQTAYDTLGDVENVSVMTSLAAVTSGWEQVELVSKVLTSTTSFDRLAVAVARCHQDLKICFSSFPVEEDDLGEPPNLGQPLARI